MAGENVQIPHGAGGALADGVRSGARRPRLLARLAGTGAVQRPRGWLFGAAVSLLGALGVFGLQHAGGFLLPGR